VGEDQHRDVRGRLLLQRLAGADRLQVPRRLRVAQLEGREERLRWGVFMQGNDPQPANNERLARLWFCDAGIAVDGKSCTTP
jgi:hypothetical protein